MELSITAFEISYTQCENECFEKIEFSIKCCLPMQIIIFYYISGN